MAESYERSVTVQGQTHHDVFVSGLERVEIAGGNNLRFVFYVMQTSAGQMMRVELPHTLIMPIETLPDAIGKALMALGRQVVVRPNGEITVTH